MTTWRLLRDRLPTKMNLLKMNILGQQDAACTCCKAEWESANHLFIECDKVNKLWNNIIKWTGSSWVQPRNIEVHFYSFSNLLGRGRWKKRMSGLLSCVTWVIWKWRNSIAFNSKEWDFRRLEEEIKSRFWAWCLVKGDAASSTNFLVWSSEVLVNAWNTM